MFVFYDDVCLTTTFVYLEFYLNIAKITLIFVVQQIVTVLFSDILAVLYIRHLTVDSSCFTLIKFQLLHYKVRSIF